MAYLDGMDAEIIKSQPMVDAIKNYISENKKDDLYSYALRKEMGLINSSNRCEKGNDIVVGDRCKGNAMSWSEDGALNIAQVRIMFINREDKPDGESKGWFGTRRAKYAPLPLSDSMQQYMQVA